MPRHTRYQGAIIQDDALLLIRHQHHNDGRTYWLFPGGGIQDSETEEECVKREMKEETNLEVEVGRLLLDVPTPPKAVYRKCKTFLCHPIRGIPSPGHEPEVEAASVYAIVEVRWFDLRDSTSWDPLLLQDDITCTQLISIQEVLGYANNTR